jgi:predicted transglutaminase-like cysteine proteinase
MSNAAKSFSRGSLLRLALGALVCAVAINGPVQAASNRPMDQDRPRSFTIASLLGAETKTLTAEEPAELLFSKGGYRIFAAPDDAIRARWNEVAAKIARDQQLIDDCATSPRECAAPSRHAVALLNEARVLPLLARIHVINRRVNAAISYQSDLEHFGQEDVWASPLEALNGSGDCEDFALAKYALLQSSGLPRSDLRLLLVRDTKVNEDHAVLAVKTDEGWLVLDNRHDRVEQDRNLSHYHPVRALSDGHDDLYAASLTSLSSVAQDHLARYTRLTP